GSPEDLPAAVSAAPIRTFLGEVFKIGGKRFEDGSQGVSIEIASAYREALDKAGIPLSGKLFFADADDGEGLRYEIAFTESDVKADDGRDPGPEGGMPSLGSRLSSPSFLPYPLHELKWGRYEGQPFVEGVDLYMPDMAAELERIQFSSNAGRAFPYESQSAQVSGRILYLFKTGQRDEIVRQGLIGKAKDLGDQEDRPALHLRADPYLHLIQVLSIAGFQNEIMARKYQSKDGSKEESLLDIVMNKVGAGQAGSSERANSRVDTVAALLSGGMTDEVTGKKYDGKSVLDLAIEDIERAFNLNPSGAEDVYVHLIKILLSAGLTEQVTGVVLDGKNLIELAVERLEGHQDNLHYKSIRYSRLILALNAGGLFETALEPKWNGKNLYDLARENADFPEQWSFGDHSEAYIELVAAYLSGGFSAKVTQKEADGKNLIERAMELIPEDDSDEGYPMRGNAYIGLVQALLAGGLKEEVTEQKYGGKNLIEITKDVADQYGGMYRTEVLLVLFSVLFMGGMADEAMVKKYDGKNLLELAMDQIDSR
ncbi:MAG TPA: hypothetical protein PKL97_10230, partial [Candidatus Omnitrophota bacterium]|nr:hypothetical protein [Candidatus Omnitrophota bacterium]